MTPVEHPIVEAKKGMSSGVGRWPHFMVIGAARSGTTTLCTYLQRHERVYICSPKEPCYFAYGDVFARGDAWYRSLFAGAPPDALCGDGSTTYSRWPHTLDSPALIHERMPDARFIYIMRHPVDRAYSMYRFRIQMGMIKPMTFEQALAETDLFLDTSRYLDQIERFLRFFRKDQFLFLEFQDLHGEALPSTLAQVQQFLGLEERDLLAGSEIQANADQVQLARKQVDNMVSVMKRLPAAESLLKMVSATARQKGYRILVNAKRRSLSRNQDDAPPMLPATREKLLGVFRAPNESLARFLERDLSSWSV